MEEESNSKELIGSEATRFRAVAARANYLSADRPDIQALSGDMGQGIIRGSNMPWARAQDPTE